MSADGLRKTLKAYIPMDIATEELAATIEDRIVELIQQHAPNHVQSNELRLWEMAYTGYFAATWRDRLGNPDTCLEDQARRCADALCEARRRRSQ